MQLGTQYLTLLYGNVPFNTAQLSHSRVCISTASALVWPSLKHGVRAGYLAGLALCSEACYEGGQLSLLLLDGCMSTPCPPADHAACLHTITAPRQHWPRRNLFCLIALPCCFWCTSAKAMHGVSCLTCVYLYTWQIEEQPDMKQSLARGMDTVEGLLKLRHHSQIKKCWSHCVVTVMRDPLCQFHQLAELRADTMTEFVISVQYVIPVGWLTPCGDWPCRLTVAAVVVCWNQRASCMSRMLTPLMLMVSCSCASASTCDSMPASSAFASMYLSAAKGILHMAVHLSGILHLSRMTFRHPRDQGRKAHAE